MIADGRAFGKHYHRSAKFLKLGSIHSLKYHAKKEENQANR